MTEEQEVTMIASIRTMEGVGPAAADVFETAGFKTIGDLRTFERDDARLLVAISTIRQQPEYFLRDASYWKRLFTRCINILYKVRSAEAADFVPHEYMCPVCLDWFHDPRVAPSGHSFCRVCIDEHLSRSLTNPVTKEQLTMAQLYKNLTLKEAVNHHRLHRQRFSIVSDAAISERKTYEKRESKPYG